MNEMKYPEFEANQVLTSEQLNQLREFLDSTDKDSAHAAGKGILGGLDVVVATTGGTLDSISIGCGAGITSGGHHVQIEDCALRHARDYVDPLEYPPFRTGNNGTSTQKAIVELVEEDAFEDDQTKQDAAQRFAALSWEDYVLLLYVECETRDLKNCTLEDCSDRGKEVLINIRKLLIEQQDIAPADANVADPFQLLPLRMPRALEFGGEKPIVDAYYENCKETNLELGKALAGTWLVYGSLLADLYPSSPFYTLPIKDEESRAKVENNLTQHLNALLDTTNDEQIQVYYDFLRDLVSAYNEFIRAAAEVTADDCPDPSAFPRHLLLGELDWDQQGLSRYRHYFCPYSAPAGQDRTMARARRLHKKIETMILAFDPAAVPDGGIKIRAQEGIPSCDGVIPYYYQDAAPQAEGGQSLRQVWSPSQAERMILDRAVTTYGEVEMKDEPNPVAQNIDDMGFLRIEGHLGESFDDSLVTELRDDLRLPFAVVALRLQPDGTEGNVSELCHYRELNYQYVEVRAALLQQLRQAAAVLSAREPFREGWLGYLELSEPQTAALIDRIKSCIEQLSAALEDFDHQAFQGLYVDLLHEAAIARVAYHRYAEAASGSLLYGRRWLGLTGKCCTSYYMLVALAICQIKLVLQSLFDATFANRAVATGFRAQQEATQLSGRHPALFENFIELHPGIEHVAGVTKGGTFIMVESGGNTVADFYLPYLCCQPDCPDLGTFQTSPYHPIFIEREWAKEVVLVDAAVMFDAKLMGDGLAIRYEESNPITITPDQGAVKIGSSGAGLELRTVDDAVIMILYPSEYTFEQPLAFDLQARSGKPPEHPTFAFWVNLKPVLIVACDDTAVTVRDKPVVVDLLANDLFPKMHHVVGVVSGPENGKLTPVVDDKTKRPIPGQYEYHPVTDFVGQDHFDYQIKAQDARGYTVVSEARVTIHVTDCCDVEPDPTKPPVELPEVSLPFTRFCDDGANCYHFTIRGGVIDLTGPGVRWEVDILDAKGQRRALSLVRRNGGWEVVKEERVAAARVEIGLPATRFAEADFLFARTAKFVPLGRARLGNTTHLIDDLDLARTMLKELDITDFKSVSVDLKPCFDPAAKDVVPGPVTFAYIMRDDQGAETTGKLVVEVVPLPKDFAFSPEGDQTGRFRAYNFSFDAPVAENYIALWDFGDGTTSEELAPTHSFDTEASSSLLRRVTLRVGLAELPDCIQVISRDLWLQVPKIGDIRDVVNQGKLAADEILQRPALVEIVPEKDLAGLKQEAAFIEVVSKLIEGDDGATDFRDGELDGLIRTGSERSTGSTVALITETAVAEGAGAVEPLMDVYRNQLGVSLNFAKLKNTPVTDELTAMIDTFEGQLVELKDAGVPINQGNQTFTMLEEIKDGVADQALVDRLTQLETVVLG